MVPFTLSRLFGNTDTYYTSEAVTVSGSEAFVQVSVTGGTLILDEHDMGFDPRLVATGSKVAVRLRSSDQFGHTKYATLTIGDKSAYFAVTTHIDGALVYDYTNESLPLDLIGTARHSGAFTWQANIAPRLHKLNGTTWSSTIDLKLVPSAAQDQAEYAFIADRWANSVYRVDLSDNVIAQSIPVHSPVGVGRVAINDLDLGDVYHYVVASLTGDIVILDPTDNYSISHLGSVAGRAIAITSDEENNSVWVIDSASRATRFAFDKNGSFTTTPVNLGNNTRPSDLTVAQGSLFVTLFNASAVAKIDLSSLNVTTVECCSRPAAIDAGENTLYVVGHNAKLSRISLSNMSVSTLDISALTPVAVTYADNELLVCDHERSQMVRMSTDGNRLSAFSSSKPLAVVKHNSTTLLFTSVSNAPSRFGPGDNTPRAVEFIPRIGRDKGEQVVSNSYVLSGVNLPTHVTVDPLSPSTIFINGEDEGKSAVASIGDSISIGVALPDAYEIVVETHVTIGDYTTTFVASTLDRTSIPDSIVFEPVKNATPLTEYTSNTVVIRGMSDDATAEVFVENGELILNGEVASSNTIQNGDTVALRVTSGEHGIVVPVLRVGPIEASFFVQIPDDMEESVLPFEFENLREVDVSTQVTSNEIVVDWLPAEPIVLRVLGIYSASLIVNGEVVGTSAEVYNDDVVAVRIDTTSGYNLEHVVVLYSGLDSVSWSVKTRPDLTPGMFMLESVYNGFLRMEYPSDEVVIRGLSTDYSTEMTVSPDMPVLLNGERLNDKEHYSSDGSFTFSITNGDTVQFIGIPGPSYGTLRRYVIEAGDMVTYFNVYARPIEGAFENPSNFFIVEVDAFGVGVTVQSSRPKLSIVPEVEASGIVLGDTLVGEIRIKNKALSDSLEGDADPSSSLVADTLEPYTSNNTKSLFRSSFGLPASRHNKTVSTTGFEHAPRNGRSLDEFEAHSIRAERMGNSKGLADAHTDAVRHMKETGLFQAILPIRFASAAHAFGERSWIDSVHTKSIFDRMEVHREQSGKYDVDAPTEFSTKETEFGEAQMSYAHLIRSEQIRSASAEFVRTLHSKNKSENAQFVQFEGLSWESPISTFGRERKSYNSVDQEEFYRPFNRAKLATSPEFLRYLNPAVFAQSLPFVQHRNSIKDSSLWRFTRHRAYKQFVDRVRFLNYVPSFWEAIRKEIHPMRYYNPTYVVGMEYAQQPRSVRPRVVDMEYGHDYRAQKFYVIPLAFEYLGLGGRIFAGNEGFSAGEVRTRRNYVDRVAFAKQDTVFLRERGFTVDAAIPNQSINLVDHNVEFKPVGVTRVLYKELESGLFVRSSTAALLDLEPIRLNNKHEVVEEPKEPEPTGAENMFTVSSRSAVGHTATVVVNEAREPERNSNETFEDKDRAILTAELMLYHTSAEDAYQGALNAQVEPERIQVHELFPGCWVWAEVLDQPDLCELVDDITPESGWIKGG